MGELHNVRHHLKIHSKRGEIANRRTTHITALTPFPKGKYIRLIMVHSSMMLNNKDEWLQFMAGEGIVEMQLEGCDTIT